MIEYLRNSVDIKKSIAYIEIVFWPVVQIKREALDKTKIKLIEILKSSFDKENRYG
jgi:hypothetical protein